MIVSSRGGGGGGERGGPSLLATLKVRVARLEAALRDKEAELSRLQASTKVTSTNELRIQAQTYYQEVVRLRNQLNISQHATVPILHNTTNLDPGANARVNPARPEEPHKIFHKRSELTSNKLSSMNKDSAALYLQGSSSPATAISADENALRLSVLSLHEENEKLREQVTTLVNTVRNSDQGMSKSSQEVLERLLHKLEDRSVESPAEGYPITQMKVMEQQGKELEWERERASLRELISTLQEDRSYYKDTASRKEDEMSTLRNEVLALQQQMLDIQRQEAGTARLSHRAPQTRFAHVRPGSASASSSDASSVAPGRRTQSTVRSLATKPRIPVTPSRSSAASSRSQTTSQSSKASSEPRELPPKSSSSTASGKTSSNSSAMSKKEQQMVTSARLASNKIPTARTPCKTAPTKKQSSTSVRRTPAAGATSRSASVANSRTGTRAANSAVPGRVTATPSSSCQSTSGSGRSTASSAASSKSNSQKATPLSSPTKVKSSVAAKPMKTTASSAYKSSSRTNSASSKGDKSSSSSSQSSRQSSKQNSTSSTPSRSLEADADVLVALLRPEPHDSEEATDLNSNGGDSDMRGLCRQRTMTLSWDSGAGEAGDTDESWGTSYRTRGVGATSHLNDKSQSSNSEEQELPQSAEIKGVNKDFVHEGVPRLPLERTVGSMDELQSMLHSHLYRQQKLNQLLQQEPRLMQVSKTRVSGTAPHLEVSGTAPHLEVSGTAPHLKVSGTAPHLEVSGTAPHLEVSGTVPHLEVSGTAPHLEVSGTAPHLEVSGTAPHFEAHMTVKQVKGRKSHRRSPDGAEKTHDPLETSFQEPVIKSPSKSYGSPLSVSSKSSKLPQSPAHRSSSIQSSSSEPKTPTTPSISSPTPVPPTLTKLVSPAKKSAKHKAMSRSSDSESSVASPGLVRQGTFNLDQSEAHIDKSQMGDGGEGCPLGEQGWLIDEEEDKDVLSATITAHISRMRQVQDFKE
ncbi:hypothetical protein FHG87_019180 [Trinorchestia longiramus]|nr:hypothetical protein FHG87_019180 [Trinorchestia longiramus]